MFVVLPQDFDAAVCPFVHAKIQKPPCVVKGLCFFAGVQQEILGREAPALTFHPRQKQISPPPLSQR